MLTWLFQSTVLMLVFASFYHFCFSKYTFFRINRFYLLLSLLLSLLMPCIKISEERLTPVLQNKKVLLPAVLDNTEEVISKANYRIETFVKEDERQVRSGLDYFSLIKNLYLVVTVALLIRLLGRVLFLLFKARDGVREYGFIRIRNTQGFAESSFFNLLFIEPSKFTKEELKQVLRHEEVHKLQWHSADKLFVEVIQALLWLNPAVYYFKSAISANHEYEVDSVLASEFDRTSYSELLLRVSSGNPLAVINGLSQHHLKNRIQFIFKKQSNSMKKLTYTTALPVVLVAFLTFSVKESEALESVKSFRKLPVKIARLLGAETGAVKNIREQIEGDRDLLEPVKMLGIELPLVKETLLTETELPAVEKPVTPSKRFTIVLDPGHGGSDNASSFQGVFEKDLVLEIARSMRLALEEEGFNVILTRSRDEFVTLADRVKHGGDVFVSIHANTTSAKENGGKMRGMELIIPNKSLLKDSTLLKKSVDLAASLKSELAHLDIKMREDYKDPSLFVLNNNTAAAVLLEVGYLNNKDDFKLLTAKEYQQKLANQFVNALKAYQSQLKYSRSPRSSNNLQMQAQDSVRYNIDRKEIELYGNAKASYGNLEINTDRIFINLKAKSLIRDGSKNSKNRP